jgi:(p)ppGpp synthase/HD superfamily hydrolase
MCVKPEKDRRAALVAAGVGDQDAIIAALHHDAIEDQKIRRIPIAGQFCEHVAAIVLEVTEQDGRSVSRLRNGLSLIRSISPRAYLYAADPRYS